MHNRFLQFIKKHALNQQKGKLLLAISGGVDSMVLWHLVSNTDLSYAVAHCNFQLRGSASDQDEVLIREKANQLGVTFHSKRFDTNSYATINKISTQMAARDLRYGWFDELCKAEDYDQIFLAHHANDNVETFILNMVRGTSIYGLTGMDAYGVKLIRPLLDFSKDEIIAFANDQNIQWREDSSNAEVYYKRNFIRKEVVPKLESLNPDFLTTMKRNMAKNMEVSRLFELSIEKLKSELLVVEEFGFSIHKQQLLKGEVGPYVLSEMLKRFGFNYFQSEEIIAVLDGTSGKLFKSFTHELLLDRELIRIRPRSKNSTGEYKIELGDVLSAHSFEYKAWIYEDGSHTIDKDSKNVMLDLDKLEFPLTLRKWREGDKFQPLGMQGQKLVSDLLIDLKLSVFEKESVFVLCSNNEIVWVVGHRVSDKFKVRSGTNSVLHYQLVDSL